MIDVLRFTVPGTPVPQGSKSISRAGVMYEANKALAPWREAVTVAARQARLHARHETYPARAPVRVVLEFFMPRPPSLAARHVAPAVAPDLDKLARAILDALGTAKVYRNDGQVVSMQCDEYYGTDFTGVDITTGMLIAD